MRTHNFPRKFHGYALNQTTSKKIKVVGPDGRATKAYFARMALAKAWCLAHPLFKACPKCGHRLVGAKAEMCDGCAVVART